MNDKVSLMRYLNLNRGFYNSFTQTNKNNQCEDSKNRKKFHVTFISKKINAYFSPALMSLFSISSKALDANNQDSLIENHYEWIYCILYRGYFILDCGSIKSSPKYGLSTPYRLTKEQRWTFPTCSYLHGRPAIGYCVDRVQKKL